MKNKQQRIIFRQQPEVQQLSQSDILAENFQKRLDDLNVANFGTIRKNNKK